MGKVLSLGCHAPTATLAHLHTHVSMVLRMVRDLSSDLRKATEQLAQEREARDKLEQRNHTLELEFLKVRSQGNGELDSSSETTRYVIWPVLL